MANDKPLRCDCGYRIGQGAEERQVAEVRRHAEEEHGIAFTTAEALAVLRRLKLGPEEPGPAAQRREEATRRGEE